MSLAESSGGDSGQCPVVSGSDIQMVELRNDFEVLSGHWFLLVSAGRIEVHVEGIPRQADTHGIIRRDIKR